MSIRIGSNISSLTAQRRLSESTDLLSKTSERLSSGQRINRASDDAAGLAIASSLNADGRIFNQAIKNVSDGVSALSIAQGGLSQLTDVTIRLKELATQSANGTVSRKQRLSLQKEADALVAEYNRITETTTFNGQLLFNSEASFTLQMGRGEGTSLEIGLGDELSRGVWDGAFYTGADQTISGTAAWTEMGDVNNDGKLDLVSGGLGVSKVNVSIGNGDGTFFAAVSYFGSTGGVNLRQGTIKDLNGDGFSDIITTTSDGAAVNVLMGNGNGTFRAPRSYAPAVNAWGLGVGDINGDGVNDLVTSSSGTNQISIFIGNGDGSFRARSTITNSGNSNSVVLADVNSDGRVDIVASTQSSGAGIDVFLGNGDGSFNARRTITYGDSWIVRAGDFNRDGIVDLTSTSGNGGFTNILIGNNDGSFSLTRMADNTQARGLRVTDLNGDGYDDIVASSQVTAELSVFLGNGNGTFQARRTFATTGTTADISIGDFTGDGAFDIFASSQAAATIYSMHANADETAAVGYIYMMTQQGARDSLTTINQIQTRLGLEVGTIGSALSRLEIAKSNLQSSALNYKDAEERIMGLDVAQESSEYTRIQILQKAATAVLGQANLQPQIALRLLNGG